MPASVLAIIYLALVCAPLVLAALTGGASRGIWNELATGAGLAGLAILLMEFALSGRFRVISGRIGMDVTMRQHQLLARLAALLIFLHPFLFTGPHSYYVGQTAPGSGALDFGFAGLWPGIVSYLLLGGLITMALARDDVYRYQHWRALHGIMALIVACFGVLHAWRAGRYSSEEELRWFWAGMLAIAAFSLTWVYFAKPIWKRTHPWTVTAVSKLADKIWEVELRPEGHAGLKYLPGHFAWLSIGHSPFSLDENPFSIASAPAQGSTLRFVIKELGDFTNDIGDTKVGTRAYVDAPFGSLTLQHHKNAKGIALIAGGVGIAPMLSHLRQVKADEDTRPKTLFYADRNEKQIVCWTELKDIAASVPLEIVRILSDPPQDWVGETGYIRKDILERHLPAEDLTDWVYLLCGPPPMLEVTEQALLDLGVPQRNILLEQFVYD